MGRHPSTRPKKVQTTKAPPIPMMRWMNMSLDHSDDDLRARNAAPQSLRGGVMSVTRWHALVATRGAAGWLGAGLHSHMG